MRTSQRCRCGDSGARARSSVVEEAPRAPSAESAARARTARTARRSVERADRMTDGAGTTLAVAASRSPARGTLARRRDDAL